MDEDGGGEAECVDGAGGDEVNISEIQLKLHVVVISAGIRADRTLCLDIFG